MQNQFQAKIPAKKFRKYKCVGRVDNHAKIVTKSNDTTA